MTDEKTLTPSGAENAALANAVEDSLRKDKARRFRKGDRVTGRIVRFSESMAFVDLGGRSEGMIDLLAHRQPDGTLDIEENQQLEAIVIEVAANGVMLQRTLVTEQDSLEQLTAAMNAGLPVQATVTGYNKGGLELELFGVRAFCPASQIDVRKVDDFTSFVGQSFQFRIQQIDGRKVVLSRRALLSEEHESKKAEVRKGIAPGAILKGTVARLQPFGAFVDLGEGIEGLIHVTEISRARVNDPAQAVSVGDVVDVQVLKVEETQDKNGRPVERIALSRRALEKDPWDGVVERFPVGSKVKGKVARLQPFGAFIELAPGVDGLAHVSTLADKRIEHPREAVKEGDEVEAYVLAVEPDKKRLSLSLKEPREKQERPERRGPGAEARGGAPRGGPGKPRGDRPERGDRPPRRAPEAAQAGDKPAYPIGSVHEGTVEKVETFGVFLALPGGGRALVPNSELGVNKNADQRVDYRKLFPAGATLRVAITEQRRGGELKASKVEADRADERAMVKEWSKDQKPSGGGKSGFGTFADLLRKANVVK